MAIDLTKLPGDMIIGADNINKKFQQFFNDFKTSNEEIRQKEAKDRAMNTEVVRQAIANQAQEMAELMQGGLSEEEAREETQPGVNKVVEEQTQDAYENETSGIGAVFSQVTGKLDNLLGVSEKANKLAEFRNDVAKKGLVQTIKDNREAKKAEEKEDALEESSGGGIGTKVADFAGKAFEPIKNIFGGLKAVFLGAAGIFVPLLAFFKALENPKFREIVFSLLDFGKRVFKESLQTIIDVFDSLITTITNIVDKFKIIFDGDTSLSEKFTALFGIFGDIGKFIFDAIDTVTENLLNVFGLSFAPYDGLASWIVGKVGEVFTTIKNWFAEKVEFIVDTYTNIKDWIVDKVTSAFQGIKDWFMGVVEFAVDGYGSLKDWVVDKVTSGWQVVKDWFGGVTEFFVDGYGNIKDFIVDKATSAFQGVKNFFGGVGDFFVDGFTSFKDFLFGEDGIVTKAIDFIKGLFDFELPSLSDLNPLKGFFSDDYEDLQDDADDAAKDAAKAAQKAEDAMLKYQQTGNDKFLKKYEDAQQKAFDLQEKAGNLQYEALMKKMEENGELTADEQQFIQQINVVRGGDSMNTNSSTGFSTRKLPFNDDPTTQALTTSYP